MEAVRSRFQIADDGHQFTYTITESDDIDKQIKVVAKFTG